jgi:hypothetical protein
MKRLILVLVTIFMVEVVLGVQPLRKPFIQIKIDGKNFRNSDILTVTPGQQLTMNVDLEGGRRDFCKFPDTYADIASTAKILSRGENGLVYQMDGIKSEWKLVDEKTSFDPDAFIQVKTLPNPNAYQIQVLSDNFSQSFLKILVKANWQFTQNEIMLKEENLAESTIYFRIAGTSDVWFNTANTKASGMKNDLVAEKLTSVQAACDSMENNFYKLNFASVQQSVRTLQTAVTTLKTTIDEVKSGSPSYKTSISFIGLPSDNPFHDVNTLNTVKTSWTTLQPLVSDLRLKMDSLPEQSSQESKDKLVNLIANYADWQYKLPENTFKLIQRYMPELNVDSIRIPGNIQVIAEEKTVTNYPQATRDFKAFLDQRIAQVPNEIQKINSTQSRLQAIRLFDGMLRSYFSSINWAEWVNTRE